MMKTSREREAPELAPSFVPVVEAFAGDEQVSLGKMLVSAGLKVNGRFFALVAHDRLVVKLPRERVRTLIADGTGGPFDRGTGQPLAEWVSIPAGSTDWIAIAREARRFVGRTGQT